MEKTKRAFVVFCVAAIVMGMTGTLWAAEKAVEKIDINKATVKELTQLKRIGPAIAARILEYREKNGPFKRPEDIMKVKGIGPKTYEMIKDRIVAGQVAKKKSEKEKAPETKDKKAPKK